MVYSEQLGEWLELRHFYQASPWFDGLVYLSVFTALAHLTLRKHFPHGGRPLVALSGATGLALAVGASHAAARVDFRLSDLGGFAWLLLGVTVVVVFWDLVSGLSRQVASQTNERAAPPRSSSPTPSPKQPPGRNEDIDTVQRVEESIHTLLSDAYELVERKKGLHRIKVILKEVDRRERIVQRLYKHTLRQLARRRWMMTRKRRKLHPQLRELMQQATDNISDFERLLEVAQSAASEKNWSLLKGSVVRMITLEEQSMQLVTWIRNSMKAPESTTCQPVPLKGR